MSLLNCSSVCRMLWHKVFLLPTLNFFTIKPLACVCKSSWVSGSGAGYGLIFPPILPLRVLMVFQAAQNGHQETGSGGVQIPWRITYNHHHILIGLALPSLLRGQITQFYPYPLKQWRKTDTRTLFHPAPTGQRMGSLPLKVLGVYSARVDTFDFGSTMICVWEKPSRSL